MKSISIFALVLFSTFPLAAQSQVSATTKNNIKAAYDALNRRDFAAFIRVCAPDFTEYAAGPEPIHSPQVAVEAYKMFITAFPDLKFEITDIAGGENGRYYLKITITGTNSGPFGMLPPTGKRVNVTDVDIVEINAADLCTSHWSANPNGMLSAIGYGSLANPSTAVVMQVYEKFGKGDIPGVLSMCADQVMFDIQDRMFDSKARQFNGKAAVGQFFQELGSKFQYSKFQPTRFVADGDDVFILIDAEYTHLPSGKKYTSTYTHHFKVTNGKVSFFRGVDDFQKG